MTDLGERCSQVTRRTEGRLDSGTSEALDSMQRWPCEGLPARREAVEEPGPSEDLAFLLFSTEVLSKVLLLTLLPNSLHLIRSLKKQSCLQLSTPHTSFSCPWQAMHTCPCRPPPAVQGDSMGRNKVGKDRKSADTTCPGLGHTCPPAFLYYALSYIDGV